MFGEVFSGRLGSKIGFVAIMRKLGPSSNVRRVFSFGDHSAALEGTCRKIDALCAFVCSLAMRRSSFRVRMLCRCCSVEPDFGVKINCNAWEWCKMNGPATEPGHAGFDCLKSGVTSSL